QGRFWLLLPLPEWRFGPIRWPSSPSRAFMARPSRTGSKTRKTKVRKASAAKDRNPKTKRSAAPTAIRSKRSAISTLGREVQEAPEQRAATADILKVIASSPDNVQPVFEAIVSSAAQLMGAFSAGVFRFVDGVVHLAAITSTTPAGDEALRAN